MVTDGPAAGSHDGGPFPAYGPVNAALGYLLFYALVTRATPAAVEIIGPLLGAGLVRLGLTAALWFILLVSLLEQLRRQLAALGVGHYRPTYWRALSPAVPSPGYLVAYLGLLLVGGAVAAWRLESALGTAVDLVRVVGRLELGALDVGAVVGLVVFFVAYGGASWAADRLLVGGIRRLRAG